MFRPTLGPRQRAPNHAHPPWGNLPPTVGRVGGVEATARNFLDRLAARHSGSRFRGVATTDPIG